MSKGITWNKKTGITAAILAAAAVSLIVLAVLFGKSGYRTILIYELEGEAVITRSGVGDMPALLNLQLQSGDEIAVGADSTMRLKLDEDKYVLVEPDTIISIEAAGSKQDSKTNIVLKQGAVTNDIKSPLSKKSSFEVTTPNSVMAVRGTVFRVGLYRNEEGKLCTKISTFEGNVATKLIREDGTIEEEERLIGGDEEVIIVNSLGDTEYLSENQKIDYTSLPTVVLEYLDDLSNEGENLSISKEEVKEELGKRVQEKDTSAQDQESKVTETEKETKKVKETEPEIKDEAGGDESAEKSERNKKQIQEEKTMENEDSEPPKKPADSGNSTGGDPIGSCMVTFVYDGREFGTQTVKKGEKAQEPSLSPAAAGTWNYDFSVPVTEDLTIEWK